MHVFVYTHPSHCAPGQKDEEPRHSPVMTRGRLRKERVEAVAGECSEDVYIQVQVCVKANVKI